MFVKTLDNRGQKLTARPWFVLRYWLAAVLFFELARIFFLLMQYGESKALGFGTALNTLRYGLLMDMSMATYITIPVLLFTLLSVFFRFFRRTVIYQVYSGIILFLLLFLIVADVHIYNAWGFRLDATPIKYMSNPKEAFASTQHLPLFRWAILFVAGYLIVLKLSSAFLKNGSGLLILERKKALSVVIIVLLLGASIIPLRGGLQLSPINQSSVYFSSNNFANQASINAPWNLMYSLNHSVESNTNPYTAFSDAEVKHTVDSLYQRSGAHIQFLDTTAVNPPNVIIVLWEGFTYKVIDKDRNGVVITPYYNKLKEEGVYFSNIYATGDRTDKGLVATLSGYPSHPKGSIVKVPVKAAKLPMLSKTFSQAGYQTSFYYGGETEFANMKAYLMQGGFQKFVSISDFDKKDQNSKWGAHDHVVKNRIIKDLSATGVPFFCTWLTLSSHEPFEVPVKQIIPGNDNVSLYLNALHYTDSIIGNFINSLKASPQWSNTVVIIIPDHGTRMPETGFKADDFRISMLFTGGAVTARKVNNTLGNQTDMAATLLHQLQIPSASFTHSRDLTDSTNMKWAFFSFNNGFGFVKPEGIAIFDNTGSRILQSSGKTSSSDISAGKALQQYIYQDYLNK